MPDRVLVAYDESSQAHAALERAFETYPQSDIVVIHVTDPREGIYPDQMAGGYYAEEAFEQAKEAAKELLQGAEDIAKEYDQVITTASEVGRPAPVIVEYAEEHDIDHIVIGSHGRRGLSRFLLGSIAESVVRRSPVSVTVIREAEAG